MNSTQFLDSELAKDEKEIERTLEKISNIGLSEDPDILSWVDAIIPNWKITFTESYAQEYKLLENSWHTYCSQRKIEPNYIVIVNFIPDPNQIYKYQILWALYNELNRDGNIVRKNSEITVCEKCHNAILTKTVVDRVRGINEISQNAKMYIPEQWSPKCLKCLKS